MERFGLYPSRLLADSAYGSAEMLGWLVDEHGIEPHVPVFDKSARKDGTFSREDFSYDPASDVYICPGGKTLTTTRHARERRCDAALPREQDRLRCLRLEAQMLSEQPARKVPRSIHEGARDMARDDRQVVGRPTSRDGCARRSRCCSPTSSAS